MYREANSPAYKVLPATLGQQDVQKVPDNTMKPNYIKDGTVLQLFA